MIADKAKNKIKNNLKKKFRVRKKLEGTPSRPRLAVHKSIKNITAQIIDDVNNKSLVQVSSVIIKDAMPKTEKAALVGKMIGEKAIALGIKAVVFDRGCSQYHGKVKALADAAREAGLEF